MCPEAKVENPSQANDCRNVRESSCAGSNTDINKPEQAMPKINTALPNLPEALGNTKGSR
jgi:hypothetical protein